MAGFFQDIVAIFSRLQDDDATVQDVVPRIELVEAAEIPEPYRSLLVHDRDMTGTLAAYWKLPIALDPLAVQREGDILYRQVVLTAGPDRIPVEAGAIKIYLDRFPSAALRVITQSLQPLGAVLTEYKIPYISAPRGFFRLPANERLREALGDPREQTLYGRRNRLTNPAGEPIADVVEILPATQNS
jgi:chorismate-pyruvate lyase